MKTTLFEWQPEDEDEIFRNFGRTRSMVDEDVTKMQDWMKHQPHLPEIMDQNSIKNFLRANKFSVEKTKRKIDFYYTLTRMQVPEILDAINPKLPHMKRIFDIIYYLPLPKLTPDKSRVIILKVRDKNLQGLVKHHHSHGHIFHFLEIALKESIHASVTFIFDGTDVTMDSISTIDPVLFYKLAVLNLKIYGFPIKAIYFVNLPSFASFFLSVLKTLLKPKMLNRVHSCKDMNEVMKTLPKKIVPKDYGGEEKSLEELNDLLKLKFLEYQDRFDEMENFKIDLNLRPKELEDDEYLGYHGNFKKLEVD